MTGSNGFGARGLAAAVALAVVISLAACGGSSSPSVAPVKPSPRNVVLDSVRTTAAAKTARISLTAGLSGTNGFQFSADGVTDFASGTVDLTMSFQGPAASLFPAGVEVRSVDGSSYVKLPESLSGVLGGGKWLQTPTPKLGANSAVPGLDQSDPSQFLAYLEAVSNGVKKVGTGTIRGVDTTHYHATIDLGKEIDRPDVPPALQRRLRQLLQSAVGTSTAMPADVWIDADGLLRRVSMTVDLGALSKDTADGSAPSVSVTLDFYDFGVPVNVEAPPADQVTKLPSLGDLGGLGGATGSSGASGAAGTAS